MHSTIMVFCTKCGCRLNIQTDNFRSDTDATGKKRYHCIPHCPIGEATEEVEPLNGKSPFGRIP